MSTSLWRRSRIALRDDSGQMIPWMTMVFALSLGMGGLTLDLGRVFVCYDELQKSTDAAALAAAYNMSLSTATVSSVASAANSFSSGSGGANASSMLGTVQVTTTPECLKTVAGWGILCTASPTGYNAVQVKQSATVPSFLIQALSVFGAKPASGVTISTTSTAAMRGSTNAPYNVAIIIDTTYSMNNPDSDASCGKTRIVCAIQGVQTLLQALSPCTPASSGSTCVAYDQASLFTFPNVTTATASNDTTCPTSNPTIKPYTLPSATATSYTPVTVNSIAITYQITGFLTNFSSTNKAGGSLNTSSPIVIAAGGQSGCNGLQAPGGDGTYYAGAIYAAQSALVAAQKANPGSLNALIILSDGDASASSSKITGSSNSGTTYGSYIDQCQQGINAAKAATAAGTIVYAIAYGAASSGCSTDTSGSLKGLSPCTALKDMASTPATFYSDATAAQNQGQCTSSANPSLSLTGIFKQVATSFTVSRLIPNGTT